VEDPVLRRKAIQRLVAVPPRRRRELVWRAAAWATSSLPPMLILPSGRAWSSDVNPQRLVAVLLRRRSESVCVRGGVVDLFPAAARCDTYPYWLRTWSSIKPIRASGAAVRFSDS
jgi:hypothetical protein